MNKKNDEKDLITTFQIRERLGIHKERLREWIDREFIKPHIRAKGRGTKNLFTKLDVYFIALFKHLIDAGFSREESANRILVLIPIAKNQVKEGKPFNVSIIAFPRREGGLSEPFLDGTLQWPSSIMYEKNSKIIFDDPSYLENFDDLLFVNFGKIVKKVDAAFPEFDIA